MSIKLQWSKGNELLLGKANHCELQVSDHCTIGDEHAILRRRDDLIFIEQIEDQWEIRINGAPVRASDLNPGDIVQLGALYFRFDGNALYEQQEKGEILLRGVALKRGER